MFRLPNFLLRPSRAQHALDESRHAAALAIAEKDAALAALFEMGTAGISEVDLATGRFTRVNRRFCEIMRREADVLLTLGPGDVIHPDERKSVKAGWIAAMKIGGQWEAEVRHVAPDGDSFWVRIGVSVWKRNDAGAPVRCIAVLQDITESTKAKERVKLKEEFLRLSQQVGRIGSFNRDLQANLLYCDADTSHMFGLPPDEAPYRPEAWSAAIVPEDRAPLAKAVEDALARGDEEIACEYRVWRRPGPGVRHLEVRARYLYDEAGRPTSSVGVAIDVTERKQAEERLAFAATHDSLTGLANRALFRERLEVAAERARRGDGFALHCIDLDRFKEVNDTLGHPQGDQLLIEAAARLGAELGPGDTLARLGGDEFAVIQTNLRHPDEAESLARRFVERASEPFALGGQRVAIGASVGVAIAPRDGSHFEEIVSAADLALYDAKAQATRGWRFFKPQMQAEAHKRRELERDLRLALELGEFELFYQPILEVPTLKIKRFEALLRWRRGQAGLVAPDEFIPIAEQNGLIVPIGAWVLDRACAAAANWPASIDVAVNVSAVEVAAGNLPEVVAAALRRSGLRPERLELEITETSLLNDSEKTLATLRKLELLGVRIAMDDFGAGHSSLGYLQSFAFDKVKIDRAFAKGMDRSPRSAAIVEAIVDLCKALDMPTTIEGVETEEQLQIIRRLGADEAQGYLFSSPRPAEDIPRLIARFAGPKALAVVAA